jgi:hypothetical protein
MCQVVPAGIKGYYFEILPALGVNIYRRKNSHNDESSKQHHPVNHSPVDHNNRVFIIVIIKLRDLIL